jgi:PPOX class probable F420-dependent enzyme
MPALEPRVRELAEGKNFCAFTVNLPSGRAMTHIVWVDAHDDELLVNTEVHRDKFRAVERDPRVTVTIWDAADPNVFAEVRGRVVETTRGPEARAHIDSLSRKYRGSDYDDSRITSERVILHISPEIQRVRTPPS